MLRRHKLWQKQFKGSPEVPFPMLCYSTPDALSEHVNSPHCWSIFQFNHAGFAFFVWQARPTAAGTSQLGCIYIWWPNRARCRAGGSQSSKLSPQQLATNLAAGLVQSPSSCEAEQATDVALKDDWRYIQGKLMQVCSGGCVCLQFQSRHCSDVLLQS